MIMRRKLSILLEYFRYGISLNTLWASTIVFQVNYKIISETVCYGKNRDMIANHTFKRRF